MSKNLKIIFKVIMIIIGAVFLFCFASFFVFGLIDKISYPGEDDKWQKECIEDNHCKEGVILKGLNGEEYKMTKELCIKEGLLWIEEHSMCETDPDTYCSYEKGCWDSINHRCVYTDKKLCIRRQKEICLEHNGQWIAEKNKCKYNH